MRDVDDDKLAVNLPEFRNRGENGGAGPKTRAQARMVIYNIGDGDVLSPDLRPDLRPDLPDLTSAAEIGRFAAVYWGTAG